MTTIKIVPNLLSHLRALLRYPPYGIGSVMGNVFPPPAKHGEYLAPGHCSIEQHFGERLAEIVWSPPPPSCNAAVLEKVITQNQLSPATALLKQSQRRPSSDLSSLLSILPHRKKSCYFLFTVQHVPLQLAGFHSAHAMCSSPIVHTDTRGKQLNK